MAGRNGPTTPAQAAERAAGRDARLAELHQTLTDQVAALGQDDRWRAWMTLSARLPSYSLNNLLLIAAQHPDATAVAGYSAWQALGRQVDKGQRGIAILAPMIGRRREPTDPESQAEHTATSTGTGTASGTGVGEPALGAAWAGRGRSGPVGFRVVHVFDVSQTSGPPLPVQPRPQLLAGQAPAGMWDSLAGQVAAHGFALGRGPCRQGVNGLTDYLARTVTVRADVDDAQAVKTLAHELAHVLLHDDAAVRAAAPGGSGCRGQLEVEAESVAYLLAAHHGLDASGYSFSYVTGWAGSLDAAQPELAVRASAERVLAAARQVLAATDPTDAAGSQQQAETVAARAAAGALRTGALARAAADTETTARQLLTATGARQAASAQPAHQAGHRPVAGPMTVTARPSADPARLLALHADAVAFYTAHLHGPGGGPTRALLRDRGLLPATAQAHQLGYAPPGWTHLVGHLQAAGASQPELLASGLAIRTARGSLADRFRDRLVLPVHDMAGQVVGLLGRAVDHNARDRAGQPVPKYLNSPDTELYRKGDVLYGLGPAAQAAAAAGSRPVLVEGPLDVLAISQAAAQAPGCTTGPPTVVALAPCGTALTATQIGLLDQLTGDLAAAGPVVAFDADPAGQTAAVRAYDLLRQGGAWPYVVQWPAGHDPASVLAAHGPASLRQALAGATGRPLADVAVDARLDAWAGQAQWVEGQLGAGRSAARLVAAMPAEHVSRQIIRVADRLGLEARTVSELVLDAVADVTLSSSTRRHAATPQPQTAPASIALHHVQADARSPAALGRQGFPGPLDLPLRSPPWILGHEPTTAAGRHTPDPSVAEQAGVAR